MRRLLLCSCLSPVWKSLHIWAVIDRGASRYLRGVFRRRSTRLVNTWKDKFSEEKVMDFKAGTNGAITVISASPDNASTAQKAADTVAAGFFHIGPTTVTVHSVREMAIKVVAKTD